MCIADNSCSISTDYGDFNSTSLSQSVLTSLGPYPWRPSGASGTVSCSLFNIPEFVQSKDRENACVDFLQIFVSSGSGTSSPTTRIFTDDGFDFTVTAGQELLQWQGGWTNQNGYLEASQLGIGYKLVSWQNDIYQYVQITSMSYADNNSVGVNYLMTGTNSYQLKNGIVVRGFVDDYCSCKPSASINDFPCGSTASFCFSGSFYDHLVINLSGSESGMGDDGGTGNTIKSWTVNPASGGEGIIYGLSGTGTQQLTASIKEVTSSTKLDVCYTETRYLGPIQQQAEQFATSDYVLFANQLISQSAVVDTGEAIINNIYSGSANTWGAITNTNAQMLNTGGLMYSHYHSNFRTSANSSGNRGMSFVLVTGSHADLRHKTTTVNGLLGNRDIHYFCSNSADNGSLPSSHPSFSNVLHSLAWKLNSASLYGNAHRFTFGFPNWRQRGFGHPFRSQLFFFPSASYGYKPINTTKDSNTFVGFKSDYDSTFVENTIFFTAINTGSYYDGTATEVFMGHGSSTLSFNTGEQRHYRMSKKSSSFRDFNFNSHFWDLGGNMTSPANLGGIDQRYTPAFISDYGLEASDTCCIQLNMNRQPTRSFGDHICQSNFGTVINLSKDLSFFNADTIVWELAGNSQGTFLFHDTQSNNNPSSLVLDQATHIKGKVRLCFTASSDNPKCTNDADELPYENTTLTPNCCPAISGCVDVYLNPGISANKNAAHCFPTMSLAGSSPIYTFTETDVSEPTWSCDGYIGQNANYEFSVTESTPALGNTGNFANDGTYGASTVKSPFGAIANFTNSYDTEIHMNTNDTLASNLGFGFFTMSLSVTNGPCTFTDTTFNYIARTFANAGDDRILCIGSEDTQSTPFLPIGPSGFIQAQATGSNGFWTIVAPPGPYSGHPQILDSSSPTTEVRIAHCGPMVELKWTDNSSSVVTLGGEEYSTQCVGSDTVFMQKKQAKQPFNILGWSTENSHLLSGDIRYTQSISASHPPGLPGPYGNSTGASIGDQFGRSNQDTLKELHVFGLPPFTTSIHYRAANTVTRDEISFQLDRPLGSFPMPVPDFGDPNRMFKWKDGPGILHGVRLANSESNGGILSQSKEYIPVGINNPSLGEFTSSALYFSGSNSASYAAASGSGFGSYNKHFYSFGLSGSIDDCNCTHIGTQGKIYYHLEVSNLRFVTNSGVVAEVNAAKNGMGTILDTNYSHYHIEPTLNVQVPVYRGILALNLMSGSVIKSFTGSSTVYHHQELLNMPAPYITASVAIRQGIPELVPARNSSHETGHTAGAPPRSYPPLKYTTTSGNVNSWYPNNRKKARVVDNFSTLLKNNTTEDDLMDKFPFRSGLNAAGYGLNYRWKARQLYTYKDTGPGQIETASPLITGSFGDTMTSESFVEAPIFFPAVRATSQSATSNPYNGFSNSIIRNSLYVNGFESGGDGRHEPYYSPLAGLTANGKIVSQSVMFELTASVTTDEGITLKNYYASCSVMFTRY